MSRLPIIPLSLVLLSCAQPPAPVPPPENKTGVKPLQDGTAIWQEYKCGSKKLPFIVIEREDILPAVVQVGKEFKHTFVYAACTSIAQQAINGRLNRKISYQGRVVFDNTTDPFEIQPGKWQVSAVVVPPAKAKPGNYVLELTISISPATTVTKNLPFVARK